MIGKSDIEYQTQGPAAILSFNRPDRMNAASMKTHGDLIAALDQAEADDNVRAVIITGIGRAFCAGTDVSDGFDLPEGGNPATGEGVPADIGGVTILRIFAMNKPVIAAVNGAAAGFGASLCTACDIRLASEAAKLIYVFARRGIAAESCVSWFLPRVVGISTAMDWMLTGRVVPASEAAAAGMFKAVLQKDKLLEAALEIVYEIASNTAPVSVAMNRQLLWRMGSAPHPSIAHKYESRAIAARLAHPDSAEGISAFLEKRPAKFDTSLKQVEIMRQWWPE
jgi:enoyl-CoA hydratase/carnithine racemase